MIVLIRQMFVPHRLATFKIELKFQQHSLSFRIQEHALKFKIDLYFIYFQKQTDFTYKFMHFYVRKYGLYKHQLTLSKMFDDGHHHPKHVKCWWNCIDISIYFS